MAADEIILDRYGGGEEARNALQSVAELCTQLYAGTPREAARLLGHRGRWADRAAAPRFVLVLARAGTEVIGFAYGCTNNEDVLELSELAVRGRWRDKGIERLLRDALLEAR